MPFVAIISRIVQMCRPNSNLERLCASSGCSHHRGSLLQTRMPRQSLFIHCGNHVGTRCYTHITPLPEHDTCIPALFFRLSDTHLKIRSAHIPLHHRLIKIELLQHEKKNVPVGSRVGTQWLANDNLIQGHAGVGIDFKYRS